MENSYRIVLADDHVIFRKGIKRIIDDIPGILVVGEANNGLELLKLLEELPADMVILDITMPELRGIETVHEITKRLPHVHVLILTMHKITEYLYHALSAGAKGYLLKEDSDEELVSAISCLRNGERYISRLLSFELVNDLSSYSGKAFEKTINPLSRRECEIVKSIAEGKQNKEIASALNISVRTVESHRANIMRKLNLSTSADLIRYALQKGMTGIDPGSFENTPSTIFKKGATDHYQGRW